jgi:hypothetical protein
LGYDSSPRVMSLEKSFSDYIDKFYPHLNDLNLGYDNNEDTITFYLKDSKTKITYFVFFYFNNIGHGRDLNCPMELINEVQKYFNDEAEGLLLDWFISNYGIPLRRLVPTELVKRV